ncbi:E3 ubiquitin-protein ligase CHIP [Linum perenne]
MGHGLILTPAKQAERLKEDGNIYFKKDRLAAAIDAYTEAIALCPNVPVYWTNRAVCHRKRNNWKKVEEDCRSAIKLDQGSFKAHHMLGLALLKREEYAEGIKALERALDLGRGPNQTGYMVEEIWQELAKAKYSLWEQESVQRSWELQNLKQACVSALKEKYFLDDHQGEGISEEAATTNAQQLDDLEEVFDKAAEDDIPTDVRNSKLCRLLILYQMLFTNLLFSNVHELQVPDYLCCRISLDIFRDPVITPSGVTYERGVILEHLQKVGKFDPITREPLEQHQLIPNLAIKEAVQSYLQKHGWAYRTE